MAEKIGLGLVLFALVCGAGGCGEEPAKIVMPESPRPLPDPSQRLTIGDESAAPQNGDLRDN